MKKSIFIAVLGMAACAATSYGQGYVVFSSYVADSGAGALTTLANGITPVGAGYTADLYYFLGTVTDPVVGSVSTALPTGLIDSGITVAYDSNGDGYFQASTVTIPGYVSGPVTFEVVAYNGASYANSAIRGRSGAFTESFITSSASAPPTEFGDNGPGMPNFSVAPVPEPTTLALAGLGGLASLVAIRRKKV